MKLAYVDLCGFRGYQQPVRFEFSGSFNVIDGRNGVGKSTIFDAVEFALTGTISKYMDAKASGESVEDYLWWTGPASITQQRYVEVGFSDDEGTCSVRRTPRDSRFLNVSSVADRLIDRHHAPTGAIDQLCAATIIRDEHIARLSLDLKEIDRFTLLRNAIGAVDAEAWISRAQQLHSAANTRLEAAQIEVETANAAVSAASRQIDQARSSLPASSVVTEASTRLHGILRTTAPMDQIGERARERLATVAERTELLNELAVEADRVVGIRDQLPKISEAFDAATELRRRAEQEVQARKEAIGEARPASALSLQARQLEQLVAIGRDVGMREGHCPLCASEIDHTHFEEGMDAAITLAKRLDAEAVDQAQRERALEAAQLSFVSADENLAAITTQRDTASAGISNFEARCLAAGLRDGEDSIGSELAELAEERSNIASNLRLLDTASVNRVLVHATEEQGSARERVAKAEARLGRSRLSETRAKAIFNAARRASAETLDQRLERVLPLMSELYKRLRPHPIWGDIEYSVRGDVRRFLKLQVGDEVNPQFVFSSGQRRATGLAFLLSINLSMAWTRWQSILLDDPVQHVDDFRTIHLAEVLSHLCASGRQIICAVEDSALADLMCRRLPATERETGKRFTLGTDREGALMIASERSILPLTARVLSANPATLTG